MENDKAVRLIQRLTEKTATGELNWSEQSETTYFTNIAGRTIAISQVYDDYNGGHEPDYYLQLLDDMGTIIDSFSDYELRPQFEDSFKTMGKMWKDARRSARGVTKILDDVLRELDDI